jgi:hypothetical protein
MSNDQPEKMIQNYTLHSNPQWPQADAIPRVTVNCDFRPDCLIFCFEVHEPAECFRCECHQNGQPCWQDSCAEIFLNSPANGGYYNFECNSAGFCLAEFGQSRAPRRQFAREQYDLFRRRVLIPPESGADTLHWMISIEIPRSLIGLGPDDLICGNLYKCASNAQIPHYLSAFPIRTERPDFHRPEFFQTMGGGVLPQAIADARQP